MNDLNTIARLNSEATQRDIPAQQAAGKYVVAEYHGLHFIGYTAHDNEADANAKSSEIMQENNIGKRAELHRPTAGLAHLAILPADHTPL